MKGNEVAAYQIQATSLFLWYQQHFYFGLVKRAEKMIII